MSKQFRRGDVVALKHTLRVAATLSVSRPVPSHLSQPLVLSIPAGAHATVEKEKEKDGEVYLLFSASDDIEVKRWIQSEYLEHV